MISTRNLQLLPNTNDLKRLCQSLAMLDAIIEPDWDMRYYSFNAQWGKDEAMASMRDGAGNGYFILFNPDGAILKGFAHDCVMNPHKNNPPRVWPGVLDDVPELFSKFLTETAFTVSDTTFCIWRTLHDLVWQRGHIQFPEIEDPDGSADLLAPLDGNPQSYRQWAEYYYERPIDIHAATAIYEHRPLSLELIKILNDDLSLSAIADDIKEIGY